MGLHLYEQVMKAGEGKEAEKRRAAFDLLLSNIHRLKHTVLNIIDLSRLESGQIPLKKEEVDLDILVSKALKEIEEEASKKGLRLINSFPKDISRAHGDSEKLQHVLLNLLDNSVKYTNQGSVTVSGRKLPGEVEVSVTDTGRGLEKDLLGKVFERFVQESPSFVGLGIGLTICREIVQRHGGKIWAESRGRDKGTTFRFTLPLNTP
ncbi:MAG: HAMP domain-containing sensor histidine kinase, partial [Candidatus Brocadiales bacterium]|nr:HAMP domain-containing sensor histidine kinase [Candidatus Brocadiales bacterium]